MIMSLLALSTPPTNCGQDEDYIVLAHDVNLIFFYIIKLILLIDTKTQVIKKLFQWDLILLKFNVETFF